MRRPTYQQPSYTSEAFLGPTPKVTPDMPKNKCDIQPIDPKYPVKIAGIVITWRLVALKLSADSALRHMRSQLEGLEGYHEFLEEHSSDFVGIERRATE